MICHIRDHKECGSECAHECRAQHIGTFHKPRFEDIVQDTFPPRELAICAVAWLSFIGFVVVMI